MIQVDRSNSAKHHGRLQPMSLGCFSIPGVLFGVAVQPQIGVTRKPRAIALGASDETIQEGPTGRNEVAARWA